MGTNFGYTSRFGDVDETKIKTEQDRLKTEGEREAAVAVAPKTPTTPSSPTPEVKSSQERLVQARPVESAPVQSDVAAFDPLAGAPATQPQFDDGVMNEFLDGTKTASAVRPDDGLSPTGRLPAQDTAIGLPEQGEFIDRSLIPNDLLGAPQGVTSVFDRDLTSRFDEPEFVGDSELEGEFGVADTDQPLPSDDLSGVLNPVDEVPEVGFGDQEQVDVDALTEELPETDQEALIQDLITQLLQGQDLDAREALISEMFGEQKQLDQANLRARAGRAFGGAAGAIPAMNADIGRASDQAELGALFGERDAAQQRQLQGFDAFLANQGSQQDAMANAFSLAMLAEEMDMSDEELREFIENMGVSGGFAFGDEGDGLGRRVGEAGPDDQPGAVPQQVAEVLGGAESQQVSGLPPNGRVGGSQDRPGTPTGAWFEQGGAYYFEMEYGDETLWTPFNQ